MQLLSAAMWGTPLIRQDLRCAPLTTSLSLGLLLWHSSSCAETLHGRVSWIHNGDTIEVTGVDAPEAEDSSWDRFFQRWNISPATLRLIHRHGKAFLIDSLKGRTVTLQTEKEQRDRYNRLLAYVYLPDGRLLNQLLLEKGYAAVYRRFDFELKADFLAAENRGRDNKRGLWQ